METNNPNAWALKNQKIVEVMLWFAREVHSERGDARDSQRQVWTGTRVGASIEMAVHGRDLYVSRSPFMFS